MQREYPERAPTYVILHEPQTRGQHLQILADHAEGLIFGEYYDFTQGGDFVGTVGMADGTVGQQMLASTYKLHFGSFGGLPVKFAYAGLGLVLAFVTSIGMRIFFIRRRERGFAVPRLEGGWQAFVWGVPAALALAQLVSLGGPIGEVWLVPLFWVVLGLVTTLGAVLSERSGVGVEAAGSRWRILAGVLVVVGGLAHLAVHSAAFKAPAAVGVLITQVSLGLVLTMSGVLGLRRRAVSVATLPPESEGAR